MARPQPGDRAVTDTELESVPEGIRSYFEEVRVLLAQELGGEPEDYAPDDLDQRIED